jgi:hypothetical protein
MFSVQSLLSGENAGYGEKVVLNTNSEHMWIDKSVARSDEFKVFLTDKMDAVLAVGGTMSFIHIAGELNRISERDAKIYMAAASVSDKAKYLLLPMPSSSSPPAELATNSTGSNESSQIEPESVSWHYPMLKRLK